MCQCGASRKTKYIPPAASEPYITDQAEIDFISGPPRWQCGSCSTWLAAHLKDCPMCAQDIEHGTRAAVVTYDSVTPVVNRDDPAPREKLRIGGDDPVQAAFDRQFAESSYTPYTRSENFSRPVDDQWKNSDTKLPVLPFTMPSMSSIAAITIAIVVIIALIVAGVNTINKFNHRESVTVLASSTGWSRNIQIEQQLWKPHHSYSGYPDGSRKQDKHWGVVGNHPESRCCTTEYFTVQVPDGETCTSYTVDNGNGGFTEKESCSPKSKSETRSRQVEYTVHVDDYGWVYTYETHDWVHTRNLPTGAADWTAYWATDYKLLTGDDPERLGTRSEEYKLTFHYKDGQPVHTWQSSTEADWLAYKNGAVITFNGFFAVVDMRPATEADKR
jgi:hypothetical protein